MSNKSSASRKSRVQCNPASTARVWLIARVARHTSRASRMNAYLVSLLSDSMDDGDNPFYAPTRPASRSPRAQRHISYASPNRWDLLSPDENLAPPDSPTPAPTASGLPRLNLERAVSPHLVSRPEENMDVDHEVSIFTDDPEQDLSLGISM